MTLCGSLRDERRRVHYTRILIFVIDELGHGLQSENVARKTFS